MDLDELMTAAATCRCGKPASTRAFRTHDSWDRTFDQPVVELLKPPSLYTFTLGCECGRKWDVDVTYRGDKPEVIRDLRD